MTNEHRTEYTYIRRRGRTTAAQHRAIEGALHHYLTETEDVEQLARNATGFGVEIGFGMGDALTLWARDLPHWQFLGIDLYLPGVGSLVNKLEHQDIGHVSIITEPAQEVFSQFSSDLIDEVRVLFPDPWPKKRHIKRRLLQSDFVSEVARTLKPGGDLVIATDWAPYAEWIREVVGSEVHLELIEDRIREGNAPSVRAHATKFERRGERLGHQIHDFIYRKNSETTESR